MITKFQVYKEVKSAIAEPDAHHLNRLVDEKVYDQSEVDEISEKIRIEYQYLKCPYCKKLVKGEKNLEELKKALKDVFCEREDLGVTDFNPKTDICVCEKCEDIDFIFAQYEVKDEKK